MTEDLLFERAEPGRFKGRRCRHNLKLFSAGELQSNPGLSFALGWIMQNAVWEAPWNYHGWPLGTFDEPPSAETAVGYIRLCVKYGGSFLVKFAEYEGEAEPIPVGVWAGAPLHPELIPVVHLDHGIETEMVQKHFGTEEAPRVCPDGKDYYHLIIAVQGASGIEERPLACHRSSRLGEKRAARVMVEYMIRHLREQGYRRIWTKTHPAQAKMMRLFDNTGFKIVGHQTANHGKNVAERAIFLGTPTCLHDVDNSHLMTGDWFDVV